MKKVLAGLFVMFVAALSSLGFASAAQADEGYGTCPNQTTPTRTSVTPGVDCHSTPPGDTPPSDTPPVNYTTPPKSQHVKVSPASANVKAAQTGILPNTGGPEGVLLIGGVALLAVGGTAVVVARRRQTH